MDEMRRLVIGAVFLAAGCGASAWDTVDQTHPAIYVDPSVPTEAVEAGLQAWAAVGVKASLVAGAEAAGTVITSSGETDCAPDSSGTIHGGRTGYVGNRLYIYIHMACYEGAAPVWLALTIAHEVGHTLGLGHIGNSTPAVMNSPAYEGAVLPIILSEADVSAYHWIHPPPVNP